jgi:hypothetical protein
VPELEHGLLWCVLAEGRLDLVAYWLEPLLDRPGLTRVPAERLNVPLQAVAPDDDPEPLIAEVMERCAAATPIEARVGPVRAAAEGIVADVFPAAALLALLPGETLPPRVTFAYADAGVRLDELEAVVSHELLVDALHLVELGDWSVRARVPLEGTPA